MRVTETGTEALGFQCAGDPTFGTYGYDFAQTVWNAMSGGAGRSIETAPAIRDGFGLLGYDTAAIDSIFAGTWGASHSSQALADAIGPSRPLMLFNPLGVTSDPYSGKGAILGHMFALDMSTGRLYRGRDEHSVDEIGSVNLASEPGVPVSSAWLSIINGRRGTGPNPLRWDFVVTATNENFYSWNSCSESSTCMFLWVAAVALSIVSAGILTGLALEVVMASQVVAVVSLIGQSLGWYCGIYPCNVTCTKGTIQIATQYWVRIDAASTGSSSGKLTPGSMDLVFNNVSLTSRLDAKLDDSDPTTSGLVLSSKHVRAASKHSDGSPVGFYFKGTLTNLGKSGLSGNGFEDPSKQTKVILTPPTNPDDFVPGATHGIERRN